jgi:putative ABC transport system permease protein
MLLKDTAKLALHGLTTHKSRTILTILGIVIGITSIMTVVSAGESAQQLIVGQFERFGPTNVFVLPGKRASGAADSASSILSESLKIGDYEDLKRASLVPDAVEVVPYAFGNVTVSGGASETYSGSIIGSTAYSQKNWDLTVAEGRYFDDVDVQDRRRVLVIGDELKKQLFGADTAVGKKVKIKNQSFDVVGVLERQGQGMFVDFNSAMLGPYTAIQQQVLGIRHFQRITVQASSLDAVPAMVRDVESVIRANHDIENPEDDDFYVETQQSIADQVNTVTGILTALLGIVAAVSLLVGGVGVMNIMYVSVTERTREIGLSKALGASNKTVLTQFLLEALFLTLSAGIIGVIGGVGLTAALSFGAKQFAGLDFPLIFSVSGAVLGVGVSVFIGLVFGIFPARRASLKSPIEALHNAT